MTAATFLTRGFCLYVLAFVGWLIWCTAAEKVREMRALKAWEDSEGWGRCVSHPACRDRAGIQR